MVVITTSCFFDSSYQLVYIFPDGFKGAAVVRSNRPNGVSIAAKSGIVSLSFPASGVLEIQEDDPIHDWHRSMAKYVRGKKILVVGESGDGSVADDVIALRYAGVKGEPAKGTEESWYVVGTSEDAIKVKADVQRFQYGVNK
jgi:hypothetical protein